MSSLRSTILFVSILMALLQGQFCVAQINTCTAWFNYSTSNCPTIDFTDLSSASVGNIIGWSWTSEPLDVTMTGGGVQTSNLQHPSFSYVENGTYTVVLDILTSDGCSHSVSQTINITCFPCTADFEYRSCDNQFINTSTIQLPGAYTFTWDFGDGQTSHEENPNYVYSQPGTYYSCLILETLNGCLDSVCRQVIVPDTSAHAHFRYDQTKCPTVFIDDSTTSTGTITSWDWNFGDGTSSTEQEPLHRYTSNGTFLVTLTISNSAGDFDWYCHEVTINCVDIYPDFSMDPSGCPNIQFHDLTTLDQGNITSWSWDFGDGWTSAEQHPSHTYSANGTYSSVLYVTLDDGQINWILKEVTIDCRGCTSNFIYDASSCPVSFSDSSSTVSGTIVSWDWNFGDGSTSQEQNPNHEYYATGTYVCCLTITNSNGDTNVLCQNVTVSQACPSGCTSRFTVSQERCPTQFTDTSTTNRGTISSWFWDFGDGATSSDPSPVHTYAVNATYTACLTITNSFGELDQSCQTVTVLCIGCQPDFSFQVTSCPTVSFSDHSVVVAGSSILTWSWDFGDGNTSSQQNPTHTYASSGTYTVCLTITTDDGCTQSICYPVTLTCMNCEASFDLWSTCPQFQFVDTSTSSGNIIQWDWDFGDGIHSQAPSPVHFYSQAGPFSVCLTILDDAGCSKTTCHQVFTACDLLHGFDLWLQPASAGIWCNLPNPTILEFISSVNIGYGCP